MSVTANSGWSVGDSCSYYSFGKYRAAEIVGIEVGHPKPYIIEVESGQVFRAASVY